MLSAQIRERIALEATQGRSLRAIAEDLNTQGVPTARGGTWHASTVRHVVRSVALDAELATAAVSQAS